MKYFYYIPVFGFMLLNNSLLGQDSLIIFNIRGECYLISENHRTKCQFNDVFYKGDTIKIIRGSAVIITPDLSRTSLEKAGKYDWDHIIRSFESDDKGRDSRFLTYLVGLMMKQKIEISSPGGVVRGADVIEHPFDSAVVLGSVLPVKLLHSQNSSYEIWNIETSAKVAQGEMTSQKYIRQVESDWWEPGAYSLVIHINDNLSYSRIFFIPPIEERSQIEEEYAWLFDAVSQLDSPEQRNTFLMEMMKLNNIYLIY